LSQLTFDGGTLPIDNTPVSMLLCGQGQLAGAYGGHPLVNLEFEEMPLAYVGGYFFLVML